MEKDINRNISNCLGGNFNRDNEVVFQLNDYKHRAVRDRNISYQGDRKLGNNHTEEM